MWKMNGETQQELALVYFWEKKEQYILKSLAGGREGNIYPTEINRLNRKFQERGDKELHLSCSDPQRCLKSKFKSKSFAEKISSS